MWVIIGRLTNVVKILDANVQLMRLMQSLWNENKEFSYFRFAPEVKIRTALIFTSCLVWSIFDTPARVCSSTFSIDWRSALRCMALSALWRLAEPAFPGRGVKKWNSGTVKGYKNSLGNAFFDDFVRQHWSIFEKNLADSRRRCINISKGDKRRCSDEALSNA